MKGERGLRMTPGDGENSYAANSRIQEKALLENRPVLQKVIEEVCRSLTAGSTMVVADIGCASGPNTLLVVSDVIGAVRACNRHTDLEVQFFLNDLPSNDFNLVFRSLEPFQDLTGKVEDDIDTATPPYYIAGLPGSFYQRLFPCKSVHLFHSSYCLMYRSKVPEELSDGTNVNEGNIYIGKTTPRVVIRLLQEQFQKDFELFLTLRSKELVDEGRMLLTFLGRKSEELLLHGEMGSMIELLSKSLQDLVLKGRVEKEKLDSYNVPYYAPSINEVQESIRNNKLFDLEHIRVLETNWDPQDDSDDDVVVDCARSGENAVKMMMAAGGPLIKEEFGEDILDELFMVYASKVANHLQKGKAKYPVIMVSLKKAVH